MNEERAVLRAQHREVAALLDRLWDPICVYKGDDPAPPGEYESYAWQVLGRLRDGGSVDGITSLLRDIKSRMMNLAPGPEDARAAEALVTWFRATTDR